MTKEDITRMAREAGFVGFDGSNAMLRKFAALVAAKKEKQIIDILERLQERNDTHNYYAYAIKVIKGGA